MTFKIAVNRTRFVEKPDRELDWETFNSQFVNMELDIGRFCNAIYMGYPYCAWMDGKRKAENFMMAQHIAIDMDSGDKRAEIDTLTQHPLVQQWGAIIHETPSHTPEHPRARVIFILDEPIPDAAGYKAAIQVVTDLFDGSDPACVDSARFFFGNGKLYMMTRSEGVWFDPDACLPLSELRRYARARVDERKRQAESVKPWRAAATTSNTFDPDHVTDTVIAKATDGNRNGLGFWLACKLIEEGLARTAIEGYLRRYQAAVTQVGQKPYTDREAMASIASAYRTVTP